MPSSNDNGLYEGYGWQSDLETFSKSEARAVRLRLQEFVKDASLEQLRAWDQSVPLLQHECRELTARYSPAREYTAILEYELPRDFRRPDVIVLERGCVVVVELKGHMYASQGALDQALGYARDLAAYHAACAERAVVPVLVTRGSDPEPTIVDGVYVVGPTGLDVLLERLSRDDSAPLEVSQFLLPDAYRPLPSIVQAARQLFEGQPLPLIKRARAATEPALHHITEIAHEAASQRTRHLVLLSGVPGSGKTLVGLQLVHSGWLDDLSVERANGRPTVPAVYLSGNGPLVEVLQYALRNGGGGGRTFVQSIKSYVSHYSRRSSLTPPEHLLVFDEAQRAHDAERVGQVHRTAVDKSEPQHLIEFCERIPEWCVLVALIGTGQAIHAGEEGGIPLWAEAMLHVQERHRWTVHASPIFSKFFRNTTVVSAQWNSALDLDTEIRFHLTPKVHQFVAGLLENESTSTLSTLAFELHASSHRFLVTRELQAAKHYLKERYADAKEARYGILASSKDKWLLNHGVDNSFQTTKRLRVGPWYNASPTDPASCCQLTTVATEFSSQGLELDFALLAWGSDLLWTEDGWSIEHSRGTRGNIKDPLTLRVNVYRVLLTRGRDGTVVFVPPHPGLDATYHYLIKSGMRPFT